jgi:hypothetical protein
MLSQCDCNYVTWQERRACGPWLAIEVSLDAECAEQHVSFLLFLQYTLLRIQLHQPGNAAASAASTLAIMY